ncbi:MAG: bifunctional 2-polyprenyl-6-hydroxyphenol methylase/3-demethylubiquinol 3-O-methyltransferase UbiG [Alphaproteobacteria bacterium]
MTPSTADRDEITRFEALAADWWNPGGKFRPLHRLNPVRTAYIRDQACRRFGRDPALPKPLAKLTALDIGCGGGLIAEPLAQLGATVTGIDPGLANIEAAKHHAAESGIDVAYRCELAEDLAGESARFDVVLALEVVEHVANLGTFLKAASTLVAPGGMFVAATLNRTLKSYALAIVAAEYVLGWLPRGTHDWHKFLRPSELAQGCRQNGMAVLDLTGVAYNPLGDRWMTSKDLDVNYMVTAGKPRD